MKTYTYTLAGSEVRVYYPERRDEIAGFEDFLRQGDKVLGFDTETSDLNTYSAGHRLRLVQFGNGREAWVLRADLFGDAAARALRQPRAFVAHNVPFDLLEVDEHLGVKIEEIADRVFDTRLLAHLIDPRDQSEGGTGLGLKPLSAIHVDPDAPDTQKGLNEVFRKEYKATKDTGWAVIDIDHPTYVLYAGLDAILAARLFGELGPVVRDMGLDHLSKFEHHLQGLIAVLQRRGMRLDVPYIERLKSDLVETAGRYEAVAKRYGVENVNSTDQVASALVAMGEIDPDAPDTARTASGNVQVDKDVLRPLADLDKDWERIEARDPNPLADAVVRAKRASHWGKAYAQAFLDLRDTNDRLHPGVHSLQARTGRMSVSKPPLQQLPSGDWVIRRALVADPGNLTIAADYSAVEMRVLAALSEDPTMKQAIADGTDLHSFTAERVFGEGFTKKHRKISKAVGFGKVYGGGARGIAKQTGEPQEAIARAIKAYDDTFPGIKRYGKRLQGRAEYGRKEVVTPAGRHLPLDRNRLYAATNYVVQSTARDLLAQAIVDVFDAGLGDHLLLPVHDELVAQAPEADAAEVIAEIGRVMESTFYGVHIASDSEVLGASWGHGYGCRDAKGDTPGVGEACVLSSDHPHKYGVVHN